MIPVPAIPSGHASNWKDTNHSPVSTTEPHSGSPFFPWWAPYGYALPPHALVHLAPEQPPAGPPSHLSGLSEGAATVTVDTTLTQELTPTGGAQVKTVDGCQSSAGIGDGLLEEEEENGELEGSQEKAGEEKGELEGSQEKAGGEAEAVAGDSGVDAGSPRAEGNLQRGTCGHRAIALVGARQELEGVKQAVTGDGSRPKGVEEGAKDVDVRVVGEGQWGKANELREERHEGGEAPPSVSAVGAGGSDASTTAAQAAEQQQQDEEQRDPDSDQQEEQTEEQDEKEECEADRAGAAQALAALLPSPPLPPSPPPPFRPLQLPPPSRRGGGVTSSAA